MAAPYVASKGTASAVTTGASTPTYPASVAANDIIFLLAISHQPVSVGVIDTPTSFTEVAQGTYQNNSSANQGRVALFWRRASGSLTGTVSVTRTGDTGTDGVFFSQMYRVVGAVTSGTPWDGATSDYGPGNATVDIPSVTVSGSERTLLAFIAQADDAPGVGVPSGYIRLVTDTTLTGTDAQLTVCHRRNIDASVGGGATTATGGETLGWGSFHVSMVPAATYSAPSVALTGNAIRFDGAQDVMKLDPVDATGLIHTTMTCWCKLSVDTNSYQTVFALEDGAGHSTTYNEFITDVDGTTLVIYDHVGLQGTVLSMTVGTWYALAIKFTAGAWKAFYGTEGFTSLTSVSGTKTDISFNDLTGVGSTTFTATESLNGMFSMYRVWSAALSDAEIKAELQSSRPVRTNDMIGSWFPLGVSAGNELSATLGNPLLSRGVGTPDWTFAAGPLLTLIGSGAVTLGEDTAAGTGTAGSSAVTGTGTPTLAADTAAGAGVVVIVGSGAVTLAADTSSGTGALVPVGSGVVTLAADTSSGTGTVVVMCSGAVTLAADTTSGAGLVVAVGSGAVTLAADTASGSGTPGTYGSGAPSLSADTAAGTGLVVTVGSGAATLGSSTASGSGVVGDAPPVTGTGAVTLAADTTSGAGLVVAVGSGAVTLAADTASGAGAVVVLGSGARTLGNDTATGSGALVPVGTGSSTLANDTSSGVGVVVVLGLGSLNLGADSASGAGSVGAPAVTGEGSITLAQDTASGLGVVVILGTGAVTLGTDTVSGVATVSVLGSGSSTLGLDTTAGIGGPGELVYNYAQPGSSVTVSVASGLVKATPDGHSLVTASVDQRTYS